MTRKEVIEKSIEMEKQGVFDQHIDPVNLDDCLPVTTDFKYIYKGFYKINVKLQNIFIINPFTYYLNKFNRKTRVFGRENLKGIDSAVLTCNHVFMFDCLVAKYAVKHKIKFVGAEFNNRKGKLGMVMRTGGMLPMSGNLSVMRKFNEAVKHYLENDEYVLFYPEQAMFYMYEKPRPHKIGAYHYAIKHKVPIIPLFITYRNSNKTDSEGLEHKYFDIHIMKPVYPKEGLSNKETAEIMMQENFLQYKNKYEQVYGKDLTYFCDLDQRSDKNV